MTRTPAATLSLALLFSAAGCGKSADGKASPDSGRPPALQAEVAAQRAARELERTVKPKDAGLATQQGLDEAKSVEEAARAAAAKAQLAMTQTRLAKAVVRAPIDGVVALRNVNVGDDVEIVGSPAPMFRVVDNRTLELTANVGSARMAELKVGQPFAVTSDAFPGKEFAGKVSFVDPAADEASRTVRVKAEVPNADESFEAGLFVVSGGVVKRVTVETGAVPGDGVEIVKGLAPGQEVVTRGGFDLRDGDRVQVAKGA